MARWYGFKPRDVAELTVQQLEMYLEGITELEYREQYSMAGLKAFIANFLGGKGAGNKTPDPNFKPYSPNDFLPPWARPSWLDEPGFKISKKTAKEFFELNKEGLIPAWALVLAPIDDLRRARDG